MWNHGGGKFEQCCFIYLINSSVRLTHCCCMCLYVDVTTAIHACAVLKWYAYVIRSKFPSQSVTENHQDDHSHISWQQINEMQFLCEKGLGLTKVLDTFFYRSYQAICCMIRSAELNSSFTTTIRPTLTSVQGISCNLKGRKLTSSSLLPQVLLTTS